MNTEVFWDTASYKWKIKYAARLTHSTVTIRSLTIRKLTIIMIMIVVGTVMMIARA